MSARKFAYTLCDNPLCRRSTLPGNRIDLGQAHGRGMNRWYFCDLECMEQYLALCEVKERAERTRVES